MPNNVVAQVKKTWAAEIEQKCRSPDAAGAHSPAAPIGE